MLLWLLTMLLWLLTNYKKKETKKSQKTFTQTHTLKSS